MRRIAIVTPFGAEERLDHFGDFVIAKGLQERGDEVRMFTYRIKTNPDYVADKTYKGIPVVRCPQIGGISPRLIWQLIRFKPDVVILCHLRSLLNFSALVAARLTGAKTFFQLVGFLHDHYVVRDRDNPLETILPDVRLCKSLRDVLSCLRSRSWSWCWENYVMHMPLFRVDRRVVVTPFELEMLTRFTGLDATVVPWGVPETPPDPTGAMPAFPTGAPSGPFLLYVGQVKKRKGWDTMLEALALLKDEGIRKELVFVTSSSPEEYGEATEFVRTHGLADRVFFLFKISNEEKAWLFAHAEATMTPSRYEGFGIPVFESWSYGVPVLGTDIPVYQDFLHDGKTGLVSPKADPQALAKNIKRLSDPELRARIVAGGRKMLAGYTDRKLVETFDRLIRESGV